MAIRPTQTRVNLPVEKLENVNVQRSSNSSSFYSAGTDYVSEVRAACIELPSQDFATPHHEAKGAGFSFRLRKNKDGKRSNQNRTHKSWSAGDAQSHRAH